MKLKSSDKVKIFKILESLLFPLFLSGQMVDTCHLGEYPELESIRYLNEQKGILQTVPFSKVEFLGKGVYLITHPDVYDTCSEESSYIIETSPKTVLFYEELKLFLDKHPELQRRSSITIQHVMTGDDDNPYFWEICFTTVPPGFKETPKE